MLPAACMLVPLVLLGVGTDVSAATCGMIVSANTTLDADLDCGSNPAVTLAASDVTFDLGGHILGSSSAGATVIAIDQDATGVTIKNGTIVGGDTGIGGFNVQDATITGVTLRGQITYGIHLGASSGNNKIVKTNIFTAGGPGIFLGVTTRDNTISRCLIAGAQTGIQLGGERNVVSKVTIVGSTVDGIDAIQGFEGGNPTLTGNTISANGRDGIMLDADVTGAKVVRNTVRGNGRYGVDVVGGDDNLLSANAVIGNGADGIALQTDADGNQLIKNTSTDNRGRGVFVSGDSDAATLTSNTASRNASDGIDTDNASPTIVLTKNTTDDNARKGIEASPGVTDGGGNKARGNALVQCEAVACK